MLNVDLNMLAVFYFVKSIFLDHLMMVTIFNDDVQVVISTFFFKTI